MKYSINAQGVPEAFGPYSQGTTAGRLVFAAGQLPIAEGQPTSWWRAASPSRPPA